MQMHMNLLWISSCLDWASSIVIVDYASTSASFPSSAIVVSGGWATLVMKLFMTIRIATTSAPATSSPIHMTPTSTTSSIAHTSSTSLSLTASQHSPISHILLLLPGEMHMLWMLLIMLLLPRELYILWLVLIMLLHFLC